MGSFDILQFRQETAEQVADACSQASVAAILEVFQQAAGRAEPLLERCSGDRSMIDCRAGCSTCCVVNVSTLIPEGIAICHYIRQQAPAYEQDILDRLEALWTEVRGLDDEDRLYLRRCCAFLDPQGRCSIYPVRPLLCRSVTSTSAKTCRDALDSRLFGEESAVLMNQFQQQLYGSIFACFADGMEDAGYDGRSFQLAGLVRYLLRHPNAESDWLAGRRLTWQDLF